jgi:Transposase IS116/IS110/IS902 family
MGISKRGNQHLRSLLVHGARAVVRTVSTAETNCARWRHGSWLEMAESEVGVPLAQCLDRRIPGKAALVTDVAAWQANRIEHNTIADL